MLKYINSPHRLLIFIADINVFTVAGHNDASANISSVNLFGMLFDALECGIVRMAVVIVFTAGNHADFGCYGIEKLLARRGVRAVVTRPENVAIKVCSVFDNLFSSSVSASPVIRNEFSP